MLIPLSVFVIRVIEEMAHHVHVSVLCTRKCVLNIDTFFNVGNQIIEETAHHEHVSMFTMLILLSKF